MEPAYSRTSPINVRGIETNRLMVVLKTKGCEYAKKTVGGCTVCGFLNYAIEHIVGEEIIAQFDHALREHDIRDVKQVDLLTLGSFLNDNEVNAVTRKVLLEKVSHLPNIKRVSFESRAEYVSLEKLRECKQSANTEFIEFSIGLESANDYVRNKIIKKALSKRSFERIVSMLAETGYDLLAYLLIKPPHLSESESIEDAVKSVEYVFSVANKYGVSARVAFEPVFITKNTYLDDLYSQGKYELVSLWSVVEIIKRTRHYGCVFVGLSDEGLATDRMPTSCDKCHSSIIHEIEHFNKTQDISRLEQLDCECRQTYESRLKIDATQIT